MVKRNILPYLEAAELHIRRIRYGVRIISGTNPSMVADGRSIFFNGVPRDYVPPHSRETAYGVEPWLSVEKLWRNEVLTKFSTSARLFERSDLLSGRFQFAVGKEIGQLPGVFVQAAVDTGINKGNSYVLPSVEAWKRFRFSQKASFGVGGQVGYMVVENEDMSGGFYRPYIFGDWAFLPNATLFARVSLEHLDSRNKYYSYTAPEVNVGAVFGVNGFELAPQVTFTWTRFNQFDPFRGVTRRDRTIRPELMLSHNRFEWNGIRPEFNIFYAERDSNIDIYDYDQMGGFVNFRKLF